MTWDEFKQKVDAGLKDQGKDGTIDICYIDCDGKYEPVIDTNHYAPMLRVIEGEFIEEDSVI